MHGQRTARGVRCGLTIALILVASTGHPVLAEECESGNFASTFEAIEKTIFENRGCASSICHGQAATGGLDLRPGNAYGSLIDVPAETVPGYGRVVPGDKNKSLLWVNLAAKTFPGEWQAPLRAMPLDPVAALSENEIEALRLWIEGGAPLDGVVGGTDELLDACLPPPRPVEINPLPPPAPGKGVQIHMPRWVLSASSEREVCFASYYDLTGQVPAEFLGADGTTFRFNRSQTRQDPISHHLIVNHYGGSAQPNSPTWGPFRCRGGAQDGAVCDPLDVDFCGADSGCGSDPSETFACLGYGPGDTGAGFGSVGIVSTQEASSENRFAPGVYAEMPIKGMILWDSHAFNLTGADGKLEAWINFDFAPPAEQQHLLQGIFNVDKLFSINTPAFGTEDVCNIHVLPPSTRLYELSSHVHKRGKEFRTFEGAWRCADGAKSGAPCWPNGPDVCGGAVCASTVAVHAADCNGDSSVAINELVTAVNIALDLAPMDACLDADGNFDEVVSINELVTGVSAAMNGMPDPAQRSADESLIYVNLVYNDPIISRFDPPMVFAGRGSSGDERSVTYCAHFDNGANNPDEVKRQSTSPVPPAGFESLGGPCRTASHCTEGKVTQPCLGSTAAARHASCDTVAGAGDGVCDACPLRGGATSEDEMLILIGQYFVP